MPTAFVTGGSGFVGGRLVERLARDGWSVRALARSDRAADAVRVRGAEPVRGELGDLSALVAGMEGADVTFHAAAKVEDFGPWREFVRGQRRGHPQRAARLPRRRPWAAPCTSAPRRC